MPRISENHTVYIPERTPVFQSGNTVAPGSRVQQVTTEQFIPFNVQPPPGTQPATPRDINTSMNEVEEISSKKERRIGFWPASLLALLALAIIGICVAVPVVMSHRTSATTTTTLNVGSSISVTTYISTTTTTANCISPYVLASSGSCVNILIDVTNCGAIGNNCSSNYTSCSGGVCSSAPSVQLVNSNFIWTAAINGTVDDNFFGVTLPFNITLYSTTTNYVYVTTNGVLCFGSCSAAYTETALPAAPFSGVTVLPYWDDLFIYAGTSQGIYYASQGNAPNRTLVFEFYTSHYNQPAQYYHFQVIFFEAQPGIVQYRYFDASDGGVSCTVGVQASSSGPFIQYSFDLANSIAQNQSLTFDTNLGTYTNSTF